MPEKSEYPDEPITTGKSKALKLREEAEMLDVRRKLSEAEKMKVETWRLKQKQVEQELVSARGFINGKVPPYLRCVACNHKNIPPFIGAKLPCAFCGSSGPFIGPFPSI